MTKDRKLRWEQLVDWNDGQLSAQEAARVETLLAEAGEAAQQDANWLRAFARLRASLILADPPAPVHEQIVARFEAWAEKRRQPGLFQRLVAALSFDSGSQSPALAGLRGAATGPRQLIFDSQAVDVAVTIHPQEAAFDMTGQVFPIDDWAFPGDFSVQLLRDGQEAAITSSDDLGEFTFQGLPAGVYELILSSERGEIVVPLGEMA